MWVVGGRGSVREVKNVLHRHMIANIRLNSKIPIEVISNSPILSQFKNYVIIHREKIEELLKAESWII